MSGASVAPVMNHPMAMLMPAARGWGSEALEAMMAIQPAVETALAKLTHPSVLYLNRRALPRSRSCMHIISREKGMWIYVTEGALRGPSQKGEHHMSFHDKVREAYYMEINQLPFYSMLADMAPNEVIREHIRFMQEREMRHAEYLASLLSMQPMAVETSMPERPANFLEGIKRAREDELKEIIVFDELERMAPTPAIRMRILLIERDQMDDLFFFACMHNMLTVQGM